MAGKTDKNRMEEIGDLFVTKAAVTVKLLPSKKEGSRPIDWFENGCVTNVHLAAKDIALLVGKLQGAKRVVRGLTLMTDQGAAGDIDKTGLPKAVEKAGFNVIK